MKWSRPETLPYKQIHFPYPRSAEKVVIPHPLRDLLLLGSMRSLKIDFQESIWVTVGKFPLPVT